MIYGVLDKLKIYTFHCNKYKIWWHLLEGNTEFFY